MPRPLKHAEYISIYVYKRDMPIFTKLYKTKSAGIREGINSFLPLRMYTLREIRGRFTKSEIIALTDHLKHMPMPKDPITLINKETFIGHIIDSSDWNDLEVSHGISYSELIPKLESLTAAQIYFLRSEIIRYWAKNRGNRLDIDDFTEIFM